jgi:membrane fusion protein (multidrug efflux system)
MSPRFSPLKAGTAAVATAALSLLFLAGCKSAPPAGGPGGPGAGGPLPVLVMQATRQDVPISGEWVAQTDGFVNAQIQPQVSGYLLKQNYKEGSEVHRGQVLFEIDARPTQATLDQAKGQLAQAQAKVALDEINVKRDTPLVEARAIARSQLDTETQTLQADQATVQTAKAQVDAAALNVGFTQVRSLIEGIAGQAQVQIGNLVSPQSVLTSVSTVNPIKVYFSISEQEYLALVERSKKSGHGDLLNAGAAIPLKLTLANGQQYPQTGRIIFVDRSVSAQTGALRIAAQFANPGNVLRPGQFGRISAQTQVLQSAIVVPQRAVTELQGLNQVDIVDNGVVHVKTVQIGAQVGGNIVVTSGLNGGETVVTEGLDKVKDGAKVSAQPDKSGAPAAVSTQGN